ncbi:hypothetical protein SCA6_017404 [Theobroma cacao]
MDDFACWCILRIWVWSLWWNEGAAGLKHWVSMEIAALEDISSIISLVIKSLSLSLFEEVKEEGFRRDDADMQLMFCSGETCLEDN